MTSAHMLSPSQQRELLSLARKTIELYLRERKRLLFTPEDEVLREKVGAFVSIHTGNRLRGCIGIIHPIKPLYKTVIDCAISAATEDLRFQPLTVEELQQSELEISVLTIPEVVQNIEEIEVGTHGLIISEGCSKGLLLPQVATEYGWDTNEFLMQTCVKAGLPPDAWKKGAKIEKFSALIFSEKDYKE